MPKVDAIINDFFITYSARVLPHHKATVQFINGSIVGVFFSDNPLRAQTFQQDVAHGTSADSFWFCMNHHGVFALKE